MSQQVFYNIVSDPETGGANVTVVIPSTGEFKVASNTHPNFKAIVAELDSGDADETVAELFDVAQALSTRLQRLSERVTVAGNSVLFDGDPVQSAVEKQILAFLDAGIGVDGWDPLVKFLENLDANPQPHSRDQLYTWLERHDFTITDHGYILGYKGVRPDPEHSYVSINHGPAIVDGKPVNGAVPNYIGATVEIQRSAVQHDPGVACASGLHFGTWDYASGFAQGAVLVVHVNPRDVVSVPTDCNAQKVRTSRYKVVNIIQTPITSPLAGFDPEGDFSDWEDGFDWDEDFPSDPVSASGTPSATW